MEQKEAEAKLIENHFFLGEKSAISGKGVLGIAELTKILYASREMLGIEYCPLLMDLAAIFLTGERSLMAQFLSPRLNL